MSYLKCNCITEMKISEIFLTLPDQSQTISEPKVPNQQMSSQSKLHISLSIRASVMLAVQLSKNHKYVYQISSLPYQSISLGLNVLVSCQPFGICIVFCRMSFNIAEISADVKPSQTSLKSHMCSIVLDQHEICTLQVIMKYYLGFYGNINLVLLLWRCFLQKTFANNDLFKCPIQNIHVYSVHNSERLKVEREGFDEITLPSNKGWSLNCETVEVIFPYEFNFAACFEEVRKII